jgi:hypothetical protein
MERELIERLRKSGFIDYAAMGEAADLIESLRTQLDEARRKAFEEAAQVAERLANDRRAYEEKHGFSPRSATPVANHYGCEEIAAAIRQRGERG